MLRARHLCAFRQVQPATESGLAVSYKSLFLVLCKAGAAHSDMEPFGAVRGRCSPQQHGVGGSQRTIALSCHLSRGRSAPAAAQQLGYP